MKLQLFQKKAIREDKIDIHYREITPLIERVIKIVDESQKNISVIGRNEKDEHIMIEVKDIFYFESVDKKTFAYLKEDVYMIKESLNQLERHFRKDGFIRINKSNAVNIFMIQSIKPEMNMRIRAVMENGEYLIINRSYKKAFGEFLKERRNLL